MVPVGQGAAAPTGVATHGGKGSPPAPRAAPSAARFPQGHGGMVYLIFTELLVILPWLQLEVSRAAAESRFFMNVHTGYVSGKSVCMQ